MKNKQNPFMEILQDFFDSYMPYSDGFSTNTIQSYKYAFRLLMEYFYTEKGIPADKITFNLLDYTVIRDYLRWLEEFQKCFVSTHNQRLAALSSFAAYAQNRDFEAAAIFMSSLKRLPKKKQKARFARVTQNPLRGFCLPVNLDEDSAPHILVFDIFPNIQVSSY